MKGRVPSPAMALHTACSAAAIFSRAGTQVLSRACCEAGMPLGWTPALHSPVGPLLEWESQNEHFVEESRLEVRRGSKARGSEHPAAGAAEKL